MLEKCVFFVFSVFENMGFGLDVKFDGVFYVYINIKYIGLSVIEFCDVLFL